MPRTTNRFLVLAVSSVAFLSTCSYAQDLPAGDVPGLHNFHKVNDHIYRGAQPSGGGFAELAKLGIKTIIDLRESGNRSDSEKKMVEAAGMRYISFPLTARPPAT